MGTKTSYISIEKVGTTKSGKTGIWQITTVAQDDGRSFILGEVKWHSGWRRYAYYPRPTTLYEQDCLREIADFVESTTAAHKSSW